MNVNISLVFCTTKRLCKGQIKSLSDYVRLKVSYIKIEDWIKSKSLDTILVLIPTGIYLYLFTSKYYKLISL